MILDLVSERTKKAKQLYNPFFRKCVRWYNTYRGIYTGRFSQFRNNIHIPLLFSVVQSDVARKAQTCFGQLPYIEFDSDIPEAAALAEKVSSLVNIQLRDDDIFRKAVDFFLQGDLYGTAVAKVFWRQEVRRSPRLLPQMGPDGPVMVEQMFDVIHYDGPSMKNVDLINFMIEPGARTIDEAGWVAEEYYLEYDQCLTLAEQGLFDMDAMPILAERGMSKNVDNEYQSRRTVYNTYSDFQKRQYDKFSKPVKITEMWGRVPRELAPDGAVDRVISVGNDNVILRDRPNPFYHGRKPYIGYSPMPDPHFFHGPGKIEVAERLQYAANRFANQKMDALDLAIDPVWLFNRQANIDSQNLISRAGRTVGVDGPVGDDVIRTLSPDLKGLQQAYVEIQELWNHMQQGTGIVEDTVQGGPPATSRQTAREFLGRQENVMTRLMLEARLADTGFVEPLTNMFYELNQQFLPLPKQIRMLGSAAIIDPLTGFPVPADSAMITQYDLNNCYYARARGSTTMLGKAARQQMAAMLHNMVSTHPVGIQMVNWAAWFKTLFEMNEFDSNRYLLTGGPTMINALSMMGGQGGGKTGSDTTGAPAGY